MSYYLWVCYRTIRNIHADDIIAWNIVSDIHSILREM